MIAFLLQLIILLVIFGLIWWVLGLIPLPHPFATIAQVVLAVVFLLILLAYLLPLAGVYRYPL